MALYLWALTLLDLVGTSVGLWPQTLHFFHSKGELSHLVKGELSHLIKGELSHLAVVYLGAD